MHFHFHVCTGMVRNRLFHTSHVAFQFALTGYFFTTSFHISCGVNVSKASIIDCVPTLAFSFSPPPSYKYIFAMIKCCKLLRFWSLLNSAWHLSDLFVQYLLYDSLTKCISERLHEVTASHLLVYSVQNTGRSIHTCIWSCHLVYGARRDYLPPTRTWSYARPDYLGQC